MTRNHAETLRTMIVKASVSLDDSDALEAVQLFPVWQPDTFYEVKDGVKPRISYGGKLYRVEQTHTSQVGWEPDKTPALYSEVPKPGQGDTPDNPIPYSQNMELYKDKYYIQYAVVYICTRDSAIPLHNDLAELVHLYVEVYEP